MVEDAGSPEARLADGGEGARGNPYLEEEDDFPAEPGHTPDEHLHEIILGVDDLG